MERSARGSEGKPKHGVALIATFALRCLVLGLAAGLVAGLATGCVRKAPEAGKAQARSDGQALPPRGLPGAVSKPPRPYPARSPAELPPIVVPLRPAFTPDYTELDPETGLHMTGTPLSIDVATWRLDVQGAVLYPRKFGYDELRVLPGQSQEATIVCPGFFTDTAEWSGVSIATLLDLVGAKPQATELELVGADGYSTTVDIATARAEGFLAYGFRDGPVPVLHGFPLRAVFPSLAGATWVKWLVAIRLR